MFQDKNKKHNDINPTKVYDFYSASKRIDISKKIKLAVAQACVEFLALDDRAFETMKGGDFHSLAKILFDAHRLLTNSLVQVQNILPHLTATS